MKKVLIPASLFYVLTIMPVDTLLNERLHRREFKKIKSEQTEQKIALFYARFAELQKSATQRLEAKRKQVYTQ